MDVSIMKFIEKSAASMGMSTAELLKYIVRYMTLYLCPPVESEETGACMMRGTTCSECWASYFYDRELYTKGVSG